MKPFTQENYKIVNAPINNHLIIDGRMKGISAGIPYTYTRYRTCYQNPYNNPALTQLVEKYHGVISNECVAYLDEDRNVSFFNGITWFSVIIITENATYRMCDDIAIEYDSLMQNMEVAV